MRNFVVVFVALTIIFVFVQSNRADLTIVQKVEGTGQDGDVTVKIKGDKERIDGPDQPTRIIDGKTGEMTNLINDRKNFVKISAAQLRAAADSANVGADKKSESSKLTPTGKKETISGYETEEYSYETPRFKASFWVTTNYPGAADILKEMQAPITGPWKPSNMGMPDYTDFKGLPIKTIITLGPNQVVTTITSIKRDPLDSSEFEIPKDFQEMKRPVEGAQQPGSNASSSSTP